MDKKKVDHDNVKKFNHEETEGYTCLLCEVDTFPKAATYSYVGHNCVCGMCLMNYANVPDFKGENYQKAQAWLHEHVFVDSNVWENILDEKETKKKSSKDK